MTELTWHPKFNLIFKGTLQHATLIEPAIVLRRWEVGSKSELGFGHN